MFDGLMAPSYRTYRHHTVSSAILLPYPLLPDLSPVAGVFGLLSGVARWRAPPLGASFGAGVLPGRGMDTVAELIDWVTVSQPIDRYRTIGRALGACAGRFRPSSRSALLSTRLRSLNCSVTVGLSICRFAQTTVLRPVTVVLPYRQRLSAGSLALVACVGTAGPLGTSLELQIDTVIPDYRTLGDRKLTVFLLLADFFCEQHPISRLLLTASEYDSDYGGLGYGSPGSSPVEYENGSRRVLQRTW